MPRFFRQPISFLVLFLVGALSIHAQQQRGLTLVGSLPYSHELNDIWGYTDQDGREYALVGLTNGVSIVDLQVPSTPQEVHFIPGATSVWRDLKTYGDHAYVTNESSGGVLIIDLSGLPDQITWKDTVMAGVSRAHNLYIDGSWMYLVGTNNNGGGIVRFSLTDPWHPQYVSAYTDRYVHDVYVRNDTAYSAEISNGFLTIIDWTTPNIPVVLSNTSYLNSFTHNTWLSDDGKTCFTTDEIAAGFVYSWDVSNPANPILLDGIRSSLSEGRAIPHNVHVKDDYLVTSYYRDGLHITDASRPNNLIEVGYYDTSPLEDDGFNGDWGAYPFLPSGHILVSDIENGLFVFQPTYQRGCYLEGKVRDAVTQAPIANIEVEILGEFETAQSRTNGDYAIGTALSGTYDAVFSLYGYLPDTISVSLSNGVVTQLDVNMIPVGRVPLTVTVKDAQTLQPVAGATVRLSSPNEEGVFTIKTISNGKATDSYFVINDYDIVVGKWGYQYASTQETIDSATYQLEVFLNPGYEDYFELDLGWEVIATCERGVWERGEPKGTYRDNGDIYNPEEDLPFDIGNKAYVTGNDGGVPFGDDVDNGYTMLISPPLDLSGYQEPVIEYWWWFLNWSLKWGGNPGNDFLAVSITDGVDTFEIKRYEGPFDTTWNYETSFYFLKYFPDLNRELRVIFYTQDFEPGNQDAVEAAIDGFRVVETGVSALEDYLQSIRFDVRRLENQQEIVRWEGLPRPGRLLIRDLHGRVVDQAELPGESGEALLPSHLPPAMYLLELRIEDHPVSARKWLHQP